MKYRLAFDTVILVFMVFTVGYMYRVDTRLHAVSAQYEERLKYLEMRIPKFEQQVYTNIQSIQKVADTTTNLNHSLAEAHRNLSVYSGMVKEMRGWSCAPVVVRGRGQIVPVQYRR